MSKEQVSRVESGMIVRGIAIPSMPFCATSSVVSAEHCPSTRTSVRARHPARPAVATALRSMPQSNAPGPLNHWPFSFQIQLFPSQTSGNPPSGPWRLLAGMSERPTQAVPTTPAFVEALLPFEAPDDPALRAFLLELEVWFCGRRSRQRGACGASH